MKPNPYEHVRDTMARLEATGRLPGPVGDNARRELAELQEACRAPTAIELPPIMFDGEAAAVVWSGVRAR